MPKLMVNLDLAWLARHDKDLLLPSLVFASMGDYWSGIQGGYYPPTFEDQEWSDAEPELAARKIFIFDGREYSYSQGLIFIDTEHSENIEATLAHEWRHHWQAYNRGPHESVAMDYSRDYKTRTVEFFRRNPHEADALRYELRHAPCDGNKEWASWLGWEIPQRVYG